MEKTLTLYQLLNKYHWRNISIARLEVYIRQLVLEDYNTIPGDSDFHKAINVREMKYPSNK